MCDLNWKISLEISMHPLFFQFQITHSYTGIQLCKLDPDLWKSIILRKSYPQRSNIDSPGAFGHFPWPSSADWTNAQCLTVLLHDSTMGSHVRHWALVSQLMKAMRNGRKLLVSNNKTFEDMIFHIIWNSKGQDQAYIVEF